MFAVLILGGLLLIYLPVTPHQAAPEVSKSQLHTNQNKHSPCAYRSWLFETSPASCPSLFSDESDKVDRVFG